MTFYLTTIDQRGEIRDISLSVEIEIVLALIDHIVEEGHTLIKIIISEGGRKSQLPTDIFEGQSSASAIRALEREWKQILNDPTKIKSLYNQILTTQRTVLVEQHKACIARLEKFISNTEERLRRVFDTIHREPYRSRILHQLKGNLERHQQNLATEQASLSRLLNQLM